MNTIVIEHVPIAELPAAWRDKLDQQIGPRVTVRIEAETQVPATPVEEFVTDDPAFGIWRDRADMTNVQDYLERVRSPRFNRDGSRNEP